MRLLSTITTIAIICTSLLVFGQKRKRVAIEDTPKSILAETSISGLKFRSLGPALTSGRISDFAVNPDDPKEYYVATSAGGVWKTINSGITYTPIFDGQGSYSIGCITMDPNNPNVIWVGTGENNNQRSVSYGDGIYKSQDGGNSWEHMGLKDSEHIGKIIVHPDNSDVVFVAAIGPLWSSGGDRGLYKTIDGGKTWNKVLQIDEHTGVNDIVMDPNNPSVLYASTFQRRRHVFTYLGGGPGSGIQKSVDGGTTWNKINKGLPKVDIGRIGLAISQADPEIIYATVEAAQGKGGLFRSTNRGASWEKRGSYHSSGNYYQEIFTDPIDPNKLYQMDSWMRISTDGGKTFTVLGEDFKHIDNHCMWIDPSDTDHYLVGSDGGVYETWDAAKTWDFKENLPVTQFYKVSVDNDEPFYNIYGGTQDNFSMGGPSRTVSGNSVVNSDWYITQGGDGFESQIDPKNPDIVYAQSQYGGLVRFDRKSGERLGIKPHPRKGEDNYRFNWDAPLLVSNHKDGRIYFAANKVFRSDDQGNSWEVISDDLTQQIDRNTLPVMGKIWGIDAVMKNQSTSPYGTIVAFDESPLNENLLYVGTDDGLIQVTSNGGTSWTKISSFPAVPNRTYVNMIIASQHDENVVYACFNNHKEGDFKPYVYKSSNKGQSWTSISGNLPERGSAYSIAEDHVNPNLLFVGTEFGIFFTNTSGKEWKQIKAGIPTIAVRDIAIQKRENDLVLGTFGRGFYVLDDYSVLRELDSELLAKNAELLPIRDAYAFEYSYPLGLPGKSFQGDNYYTADNLGSEAIFTYFMKDEVNTAEEKRRKREEDATNNPYPTYEQLSDERNEDKPYLLFTIGDQNGDIVRKIKTSPGKGINRIHWDLRTPDKSPISFSSPSFYNPFGGRDEGTLVMPGKYTVNLSLIKNRLVENVGSSVTFQVKPLNNTTLPAQNREELARFQEKVARLSQAVAGSRRTLSELNNQLRHIKEAVNMVEVQQSEFMSDIEKIENKIRGIQLSLNGDRVARTLDIDKPLTIGSRIGTLSYQSYYSTSGPTKMHLNSFEIAEEEFKPILTQIRVLVNEDMKALQEKLVKAGAPYTPNTLPEYIDY